MYEEHYDLTQLERDEVSRILTRWESSRKRHINNEGQPVPFVLLSTGRFLVDTLGYVYLHAARGTPKQFDAKGKPQGAPRRNNVVEMWTGHWRKTKDPTTGETVYAKCLAWAAVDQHINAHPGMPNIGWYRNSKGWRHPHEPPDRPTQDEVDEMEDQLEREERMIAARMEQEGVQMTDTDRASMGVDVAPTYPTSIFALRKLAKEKGVDVSDIKGKGAGKRIVERLEAAVPARTNQRTNVA